ncbi:Chitin synthase, class 2 [Chytridiales sp. JEL 0842]|nr:Chitin synthase, class 2 [Chytridiales sp. JEL 0842]
MASNGIYSSVPQRDPRLPNEQQQHSPFPNFQPSFEPHAFNSNTPQDPRPNSNAIKNFQSIAMRARLIEKEVAISETGGFVVDVPVSKHLIEDMPYGQGEDFTHLRYSAATCDASSFSEKYSLRQRASGRRTRIAVVVTMYNEDANLYSKTMTAIMKNIAFLCSGSCAGWGKEDWKEIVVCVVADGRATFDKTNTKNVMALQGCYHESLPKATVNGKPVLGHIFEYTTQIAVTSNLKIRRPKDKAHDGLTLVPCQTIFILKEKNARKINSHRWFFQAVCESLDPEVTILIDVGTKPSKESFFHLYKAFNNPMVAGACGEIVAELGPYWRKALNPVVAVQNFEYKISNILDKPLESVFGYISVLPGAFSAYRYSTLKGRPLECYFKGESSHGRKVSEANMYLAEDRILCFELVMKPDKPCVLKYVKSARAETDVPHNFESLIKQRRRWLNGSFFASVYATQNWMRIGSSAHSTKRKIALYVEFFYNFVNLCFSWFNISSLYLSFYFLFNPANNPNTCITSFINRDQPNNGQDPFYPAGPVVFDVLRNVYLACIVATFMASLGNKPDAGRRLYYSIAIIFGLLMGFMLFMGAWSIKVSVAAYNTDLSGGKTSGFADFVSKTPLFRDLVISTVSTFGLYLVSSIMFLDPWHCFTCILQYVFMIPSFVNILMVYAFCNIHDVSWGTRDTEPAKSLGDVVTTKNAKGETVANVALPADDQDADAQWEELKKLVATESKGLRRRKDNGAPKTGDDDFFKQFRTNVLLAWLASNGILCYIFTSPAIMNQFFPNSSKKAETSRTNPFLTFLFWSVTFLALVRFVCSTIYLIGWWRESLSDAGKRDPLAFLNRRNYRKGKDDDETV